MKVSCTLMAEKSCAAADYPQPEIGAPKGVKGIFEDAGYVVYNPSLPFHDGPSNAYNVSDIPVSADDYAVSLADVRSTSQSIMHICTITCMEADIS